MCQNHKIWKEIIPKVKSTLRFAAFVFSPLLKWWWMTICRLKLLWPSCRPAFAQPAVKLSLKAVVKSCSSSYCHSLNYDIMSWLHTRTIIMRIIISGQGEKERFHVCPPPPHWSTSQNSLASLAKISNSKMPVNGLCARCINHIHFTRIGRLKNSPGRPVGTSPDV